MSLISEPVVNLGALFEISFLLKLALIVVILSNFKCLPLVWHVSILLFSIRLRATHVVMRSKKKVISLTYSLDPPP